RHTRFSRDWSSDVCSSDLGEPVGPPPAPRPLSATVLRRPPQPPPPPPGEAETFEHWDVMRGEVHAESGDAEDATAPVPHLGGARSEERRVGKERRPLWTTC